MPLGAEIVAGLAAVLFVAAVVMRIGRVVHKRSKERGFDRSRCAYCGKRLPRRRDGKGHVATCSNPKCERRQPWAQ